MKRKTNDVAQTNTVAPTEASQPRATSDFRRVAVVNRGEPAVRFLRALRDYNVERGTAIEAVALVTDTDVGAPFARLADAVVRLGPALQPDGETGLMISAYLRHEAVIDALVSAGCDAVWPGWGFIAEDPSFVSLLEARGLVFLGPSAEAMRQLGDKIQSKKLAEKCGVPMADWAEILESQSDQAICEDARKIGFPLMVKASAGGGGRGIRKVSNELELMAAIPQARQEVAKVFGAGGLFMEACVTGARHIEVQLVSDVHHRTIALGVRDCTVQRRNQKILEESPAPNLPSAVTERLCESSCRLATHAGYRSAGTAEFLYDPVTEAACFLEVNSRLQVEHTVTECVTGVDLVHAQIDVARGLPLTLSGVDRGDGKAPEPRGWAIQARLCAEDSSRGFAPSPGMLRIFRPPTGPGIRVDSGVEQGTSIAPEFDSMIAKVIGSGASRAQAIARLRRALTELQVVVEDGATNKALLLELLQCPAFTDDVGTAAGVDTGWLDRALADRTVAAQKRTFEALILAAIVEQRRRRRADIRAFFAAAQDGIPQDPPSPKPQSIDLCIGGQKASLTVADLGGDRYLVGPADALHVAVVTFDGEHTGTLQINGERYVVWYAYGRKGIAIEVDGQLCTVEPATGGAVKSPAPAMVVHVNVTTGQAVEVGDRLLTLEAMKLEMPLFATESGVVKRILCAANQQVGVGQTLVHIDAAGDTPTVSATDDWPSPHTTPLERLFAGGSPDFAALDAADPAAAHAAMHDLVTAMRSVLLGFDVSDRFSAGVTRLLGGDLDFSSLMHPERWLPVTSLLHCFADVQALFDRTLPVSEGGSTTSAHSLYYEACRRLSGDHDGAFASIDAPLRAALRWYGLQQIDDSAALRTALWRLHVAHHHPTRRHELCSLLLRTAMRLHEAGVDIAAQTGMHRYLDQIARHANPRFPYVADNARQAEYVLFAQPRYIRRRREISGQLRADLAVIAAATPQQRRPIIERLVATQDSLVPLLVQQADPTSPCAAAAIEVIMRRTFTDSSCAPAGIFRSGGATLMRMLVDDAKTSRKTAAILCPEGDLEAAVDAAHAAFAEAGWQELEVDLILPGRHGCGTTAAPTAERLLAAAARAFRDTAVDRVTLTWHNGSGLRLRTLTRASDDALGAPTLVEQSVLRDIHPDYARRFELHRLTAFELEPIDTSAPVHAFFGRAIENPRDERILVYTGVREIPSAAQIESDPDALWELERAYFEGVRVLREAQVSRTARDRFHWNRLTIYVRKPVSLTEPQIQALSARLESPTRGLGLEKVVVRCRLLPESGDGPPVPCAVVIAKPGKHRLVVAIHPPTERPVRAMSDYALKVVRARRLGLVYPYELIRMLTGAGGGEPPHPDLADGRFVEYDLSDPEAGTSLSVADRPMGQNQAAVVVGILENRTDKHPEGLRRVWIGADPTRAMGALAKPECRRVIGALELAERLELPVEWVSISAGAKIAMDSGTENLDWTARVLKKIVLFTQAGGVIHVVVCGVNVGAQSYWNAEATMLMHTRGLLIMTDDGSMVLTGKKALEYSGSVAAEDERGIGGFERVMGPNGQAQLYARDLAEAFSLLMQHYRCTHRGRGEALPRRHPTVDQASRNILTHPYDAPGDDGFATVGEIFDDAANPGRKRPFDVRAVMRAVIDSDATQVERFGGMTEGETAVIWDAHVGGFPVAMIGFQSRPLPRSGRIPTDGPDTWTGGTLFPQSSKKVARAINAASGNRPVVVLANLSGFDGSPESLRQLQLEYGAEIGRAVVNFQGPILFVVIGRYHGGAYVVFSKALNDNLVALALSGTYASVIGGAPAAAVVFPREVRRRAEQDARVLAARDAVNAAAPADKPRQRERLQRLVADVRLEKQGEVATEFDAIHTVARAVEVGSLDAIIDPAALRPELIDRLANWWQRAAVQPATEAAAAHA